MMWNGPYCTHDDYFYTFTVTEYSSTLVLLLLLKYKTWVLLLLLKHKTWLLLLKYNIWVLLPPLECFSSVNVLAVSHDVQTRLSSELLLTDRFLSGLFLFCGRASGLFWAPDVGLMFLQEVASRGRCSLRAFPLLMTCHLILLRSPGTPLINRQFRHLE